MKVKSAVLVASACLLLGGCDGFLMGAFIKGGAEGAQQSASDDWTSQYVPGPPEAKG